jgi:hypothetical protein
MIARTRIHELAVPFGVLAVSIWFFWEQISWETLLVSLTAVNANKCLKEWMEVYD